MGMNMIAEKASKIIRANKNGELMPTAARPWCNNRSPPSMIRIYYYGYRPD